MIGESLAGELKDPRVGFVTVTDVRTSADLRCAHVYVSVLGDASARRSSVDGLQSAHGFLQRRIARELALKRTPTLRFHYDETTDRAMAVERLLRAASTTESVDEPSERAASEGEGRVQESTARAAATQSGRGVGA